MSSRRTAPWLAGFVWTAFALCGATYGQPAQPQQQSQPTPQYSATLNVGDPAPAFTLPGSDGKTHSLSDAKGKTVVLAWFPKAFTGG